MFCTSGYHTFSRKSVHFAYVILTLLSSTTGLVFSYPSVLSYVLGAQKNRLIETVLLSTQNICFG